MNAPHLIHINFHEVLINIHGLVSRHYIVLMSTYDLVFQTTEKDVRKRDMKAANAAAAAIAAKEQALKVRLLSVLIL